MMITLSEEQLIDGLKKGAARAQDLIALATEFHGGPITTEYLLTSFIAAEFAGRDLAIGQSSAEPVCVITSIAAQGFGPSLIIMANNEGVRWSNPLSRANIKSGPIAARFLETFAFD